VGNGKKAVYHRFQSTSKQGDKPFHWNGPTNGVTQSGVSNKLKVDKIPTEIRRL